MDARQPLENCHRRPPRVAYLCVGNTVRPAQGREEGRPLRQGHGRCPATRLALPNRRSTTAHPQLFGFQPCTGASSRCGIRGRREGNAAANQTQRRWRPRRGHHGPHLLVPGPERVARHRHYHAVCRCNQIRGIEQESRSSCRQRKNERSTATMAQQCSPSPWNTVAAWARTANAISSAWRT